MHLSPKERFGYVVLGAVFLAGTGFVVAQRLHRPAAIELHQTPQPAVTFDHGPSESSSQARKQETEAIVDVAGAVQHPGLVKLPPGSRVADAVREAGGPAQDANIDAVNLAAKLEDGSQVYVPHQGEQTLPPQATEPEQTKTKRRRKEPAEVVDLNTAGATELTTLPGIGPATAQKIIAYRSEHGSFHEVDDLLAIPGLGKKKLEAIRQWLTTK